MPQVLRHVDRRAAAKASSRTAVVAWTISTVPAKPSRVSAPSSNSGSASAITASTSVNALRCRAEQELDAEVAHRQQRVGGAELQQDVGPRLVFGAERGPQQQLGNHGEDRQRARREGGDDRERAGQHGPRVATGGGAAGRLGQHPEAEADGDPHQRLGGDGRCGVDARHAGGEDVLGHDHVDVLERGDERERDDRQRGAAGQTGQRVRARVERGRAEPAAQQPGERDRGDGQRGECAEVGAGDVEADADQHERQQQPPERLEQHAQPDFAVGARRLQQPALQAQQQPHHGGGRHRGGRPLLVDVDQVGEPGTREDRHDGDARERDEDVAAPARERAGELAAATEPAERGLARRDDLERRAGDEQDHGQVEQRGQRAVAVGAQQPREDDGEDDRDEVRPHRRGGEADRLAGLGIARGNLRPGGAGNDRLLCGLLESLRGHLRATLADVLYPPAHAGLASNSGRGGHFARPAACGCSGAERRGRAVRRPVRRRPGPAVPGGHADADARAGTGTAAPAPAPAAPAPAAAPTAAAAPAQAAQLPRTGWDAAVPGLLGLIFVAAGVALRAHVRRAV